MAYRIKPRDRTAQAALRRIACSQIDRAIAEIDAAGLPREEVVHRVRRRVKKLRPSRMRSTSKRIGADASPRRMKYACSECTANSFGTDCDAAIKPCATI